MPSPLLSPTPLVSLGEYRGTVTRGVIASMARGECQYYGWAMLAQSPGFSAYAGRPLLMLHRAHVPTAGPGATPPYPVPVPIPVPGPGTSTCQLPDTGWLYPAGDSVTIASMQGPHAPMY